MNSGENWKEPSSSTILIEASFNGDNNEENLTVNKTCWKWWKINGIQKHIQILPAPKKGAMENIGKGVHYYSSMSLLRNLLNVKHYPP